MGTEPIIPLMFRLAIPAMIGMGTQALYNVVDTMYVGRVSEEALSALSLAFPVQMVLISIGVGTGVGTSSLIARRLGEKRIKEASLAAENAIFLSVMYWLVIMMIGWLFADDIIRIFSDRTVLIRPGGDYIRIIMMGSIAMFFPMITNNIIRGEGNTFTPMIALIIGAVTNIILDPFLIFGIGIFPEMGVRGAALATVFSRGVSGVFLIYALRTKTDDLKISPRHFKVDFSIIIEIYKVGLPAMFMQMLASVTIGVINKIAGSYNIYAIAIMGIFFRLQSFILMPVFGLGQGYIPIMGYNYGRGDIKRMKETLVTGFLIATSITFIGFVLFRFFPENLIRLFNSNPELIKIGVQALRRIALGFPVIGASIIGAVTFQALGKGVNSLVVSFLRQIGILLPVIYLLSRIWTFENMWYAFPISEYIDVVVMYVWLSFTLKKIFKTIRRLPEKETV